MLMVASSQLKKKFKLMKNIILLLVAFFALQNGFAQTVRPNQAKECPPPKFKKGQTSAQVNEDTRKYVECVTEFNKRQNERKEQLRRELAEQKAEKEKESQRLRQEQANERERNRQNAIINREKRKEERRRQEQERRDKLERERLKRDLERDNQPEVQG